MEKNEIIEAVDEEAEVESFEQTEEIAADDTDGEENITEGEEPYEEFYEEEEEGDVADADADAEENDFPDEAPAEVASENEIEEAARALLESLGAKNVDDPVKALDQLTAEALGMTYEEYSSKKVQIKEAQAKFNKQAKADIEAIHEAYPETKKYASLKDLPNVRRFAALMDDQSLGLDAVGAFAASHPDIVKTHNKFGGKKNNLADTKAHITSSVPKGAKDTSTYISKSEMASLRQTFGEELSDAEIKALYKKVTG